ncbi:MAG TPA: amylo-alpha-1,6-glucosidase [Clostridia bacterium]
MEYGKSNFSTYARGIEKEWLLTNGIGGFASSTIIGSNTRRYHGLLVAALNPPVARHLILSKLDESIIVDNTEYNLHSYETQGFIMEGFRYQQRFVMDPIPQFIYSIKDIFIEKKVCMVYGENTVAVIYRVLNGSTPAVLRLRPLVNFRDYHYDSSRQYMNFAVREYESGVKIKPYNLELDIDIYCSDGKFKAYDDCYFMNMHYAAEGERGLKSTEDHYMPGSFEIELLPGEDRLVTVIATVEKEIKEKDGLLIIEKEIKRLDNLIQKASLEGNFAKRLVLGADSFIVRRDSTHSKTIIAGYPWFTDWGRDTMIALPGLTLSTGRYDDAKDILYTFSRYVKYGLVPNVFPDYGEGEPPYNTVDASLWYFEAVHKYLKYTNDVEFVKSELYKPLGEIISAYANGTIHKIKMDEDYLICAGDKTTQLTWMDAKVDDWVVTPRHGKAVEINALWYNALKVYGNLSRLLNEDDSKYEELAEKCRQSFAKTFWNNETECLFDVITEGVGDGSIRPNQIMAVSLTYPVIEGDMARKVVNVVWEKLYATYGLRSLAKEDAKYRGIYTGDRYERDGAYHQGTVWTWPLGQFVSGFVKAYGGTDEAREKAALFLEPFKDHLNDACIGSISEIFDGDEPHTPRGCFAQAWSVGEVLRAYTEDVLGRK